MSAFECIFTISYSRTNIKTARPVVRILLNSLDFWSSKTITSILLLSVVLLKPIQAITFRTKFLLVCSICVPPNNPITACGATSFPGYHSFPKWAIVIAVALLAFNDLGHLVTSIFLLMDHFLYRNEENLSTRSLIFLQNALSKSVIFSSSFICETNFKCLLNG